MPILRQAIDVLALRGTCGFVGGAPEDSELTFVTSHVMNGGRTIRGIILGATNPEDFLPKLVELHAMGRFPLEKLEPISKSSEEDNEAGELDKAEEVLSIVLPADEDATLPLYPGEEALDQPAPHIAA